MKKIFTLIVMGTAAISASAQVLEKAKFFDNWSIGVLGGGVSPTVHHRVIADTRAVGGVELSKQITPVVGVGVQAIAGINTQGVHQKGADGLADNVNATAFGTVNLNNLFAGYKGASRLFEVEALAGIGFNYYRATDTRCSENSMTSKLGLNANFNLGKEKAWTVSLRPAIVYDLEGPFRGNVQYNINSSVMELTAGVTYHFKGSNGAHHFTLAKLYDQGEVDGLNAKINDLRAQLNDKEGQISNANSQIRTLQQQLNEARNKKPIVEKHVIAGKHSLESVVTFRQGKSVVDASQLPNVERIATYMKNHQGSKVVILGYASPEGSQEVNERIALARAEAVRSLLVTKYGIASSRITAKGQGVGNMFEEADWNRVSICTITDK